MKLPILISLFSAVSALALVPPLPLAPNASLVLENVDMPDSRFAIARKIDSEWLPVEPTLINVLHFMGVISVLDFTEEVHARTYSAPGYRQIQIRTFAKTEMRFLLWGIYSAISLMIKTARFHSSLITLYWEKKPVGQIGLGLRPISGVLSADDDSTVFSIGNETVATNERILISAQGGQSNGGSGNKSVTEPVIPWKNPNLDSAVSPTTSPANKSLSGEGFMVDLYQLSGARPIPRNDVFLTFYTALLHVAQYTTVEAMDDFDSKFPDKDVWLDMYEVGDGCQWGRVLNVLVYVPRYMTENRAFGFKETFFEARQDGEKVCEGSINKSIFSSNE